MSEKQYVVPNGMLKAAREAWDAAFQAGKSLERGHLMILETALRWLAENPIVPTGEQYSRLSEDLTKDGMAEIFPEMFREWQRRMFLAPEVPEDIKDLMGGEKVHDLPDFKSLILEAYRRGQQSNKSK